MGPKLYHAGFRGRVARSTLADANEHRDWRIYADFAHVLIAVAKQLYANDGFAVDLDAPAYAFDSTTIDLCLSLFPWARFRRRKGAVKLHTLLDLRGNIPCFIRISHGKMHDVRALDDLVLEPGAFYIMDRGYIDFARLYVFTQQSAFFIVRGKRNMDYARQPYQSVDKSTGLRSDQKITLQGPKTSQQYPAPLRRITYRDAETQKRFTFLTNNWTLPALCIARLYKCRWQVELFFKWIKQHLRIKAFYGTSPNAVKTQVWIAISVYVLVAILKKELKLERSLYEILQILSVALFEKTPVFEALSSKDYQTENTPSSNQLSLFDL
jgi:transposase